jgi:hypothetical protein
VGENPSLRLDSTDKNCESLFLETQYMDQWEANHHFCNSSEAKRVMNWHLPTLITDADVPGMKRKCADWKKSNKEMMQLDEGRTEEKHQWYLKEKEEAEKIGNEKVAEEKTAEDEG